MAVAWIGNREASLEQAVEQAASLLKASRCPVFTLDTDIHGTRAAIALAEQVGGAYDVAGGEVMARETALYTDKGGIFADASETRRRADVIVVVGSLPDYAWPLIAELAETVPDLSPSNIRRFFVIGDVDNLPPNSGTATNLSCGSSGLGATLAALRAKFAKRKTAAPVENFDQFAAALAESRFPVFLFSGKGCDLLEMEMLQGLVSDLNLKSRASALHLPASESGWGSMFASGWMTGFPPRTGFGSGHPEYDRWRFDVARMIEAGEADVHVWVAGRPDAPAPSHAGPSLIALAKTPEAVPGAAVTIAVGTPGIDHDAVVFTYRTGTFRTVDATEPSEAPAAASILRSIAEVITPGVPLPC
ncbi:tungsten formylmethanofuran dehydrogenase [Pseudaminobacter sp. 19-2017]|uniref:Tungsten formylmethanofuran dehydrogenase n=1 Tax=Pseudaminobacter soli (ex Zhang et al. 2022) TaxID=2831468 RepID=A0A942I7G7_9HYPH|nr:tungsten formylmethanofuran dehydrogenase [Pseudaminobacter soli]MBS3648380.1 tungsten formylmethanofuran dehydrogenase [Pseudaminobacter soli]